MDRYPGVYAQRYFNSHDHLASVKSFGVAARSVAFHSPQPHQGQERIPLEPPLGKLRLEGAHEVTNLPFKHFRLEWYEHARLSHVSVILRNFVLQN